MRDKAVRRMGGVYACEEWVDNPEKQIFSSDFMMMRIAGHNAWLEAVTQTCFDAAAIVGGKGSSE